MQQYNPSQSYAFFQNQNVGYANGHRNDEKGQSYTELPFTWY